jgi:hypothetical protein
MVEFHGASEALTGRTPYLRSMQHRCLCLAFTTFRNQTRNHQNDKYARYRAYIWNVVNSPLRQQLSYLEKYIIYAIVHLSAELINT